MADQPPQSEEQGRVLPFRHRRSDELGVPDDPLAPDDLAQYQRDAEPDDYRHRMAMNVVALVVITGLVGAGLWLATTMADMRKNQDCVLSGRRGCTPVDIPHERW